MTSPPRRARPGIVIDADGRAVRCIDPVRLFVRPGDRRVEPAIPRPVVERMAEELLPRVRRHRRVLFVSTVLAAGVVAGGTAGFAVARGRWPTLDPVMLAIHAAQVGLVVGGPVLAWWILRARYVRRTAEVLLRHGRCPHCGYALAGLAADPGDGATTCPECGCRWRLG